MIPELHEWMVKVTSLDSLMQEMNVINFKYITGFFPDPTKHTLMLSKWAYLYEYVTSMTKFEETALPPQNEFYYRLKEEPLSDVACTTVLVMV